MRYNAFFGELPINAFKPIGGRMTLHGGGNPISAVTNAIGNVASGVGDVVGGVAGAVSDAGSQFDDFVNNEIPGGWTGAALIAAGAYYAPEIGAWLDSSGAVVPNSAGVAPQAGAFTGELPAGYAGYTAPEVTTLGNVAGTTEGMASGTALADVGAGDALSGIDLGGVGGSPNTLGGLSTYNAAVPAAATSYGMIPGGIGGATSGTGLAEMLPYMTAAQVGSGVLGAYSANQGAKMQANAANNATAAQQANFNTINAQQAPQRGLGYTGGVNQIGALGSGTYGMYDANGNPIGTGQGSGYLTHQFDANDLKSGLAPNYDFMLGQGQMANQRAANAGGGALGGNALQGLNKYTQDYAGNAYQNAFTNYQNQRSNIYNTLAGIAGIGQTAQNATNTAATNATNAASQLGVGSAAAQAAGTTGVANALGNSANSVVNNYTLASLLNQGGRVA